MQGFWVCGPVVLESYCQSGSRNNRSRAEQQYARAFELVVDEGVGVEGEGMEGL